MTRPVRKAIFPVAGLGTRFLPATKAQPKEMLTIIDKPIIQFAVEEALAAGITHLIFVIGRTKRSIADHFDSNPELDAVLRQKGKHEIADMLNSIVPDSATCIYFRQSEALGLGHAVACAAPVIDPDEPFAVILADDLMRARTPVLKQMVDHYQHTGRSMVAIEDVDPDMVSQYGIVDADPPAIGQSQALRGVVEKPTPAEAPGHQAIVGRYILDGSIMPLLKAQTPGAGGEIQLTDAIRQLVDTKGVDAFRYAGQRYDCGAKLGFISCTIASALAHPDFGDDVRKIMEDMLKRSDPH